MPTVQFTDNYSAVIHMDGQNRVVVFRKGDKTDLPDHVIAFIKRDSPGILAGSTPDEVIEDSIEEPTGVIEVEPLAEFNRMHHPPNTRGLHAVYDERVATLLLQNGYATLEEVASATDDDLLAIDGVGPSTLQTIREAQGEDHDEQT